MWWTPSTRCSPRGGRSPRTGCTSWCAPPDSPTPVWNVDLRLPGGPHLGGVDAYWPEQAVAVELDTRAPRHDEDALWSEYARKREHLERLGITVVHITPKKLRESLEQQATVVRTALMAATDRDPAAYVVVLPR